MRLRISLRLILFAFAVVVVALYAGVARPTFLANRFASAVNARDLFSARIMVRSRSVSELFDISAMADRAAVDKVWAEIEPRDWQDLLACRRRIGVHVARHESQGDAYRDWLEDSGFVAWPTGIDVVTTK